MSEIQVLESKFVKFRMSIMKQRVSSSDSLKCPEENLPNSPCRFSLLLGQTLYTLYERDQSKCKFFRLLSAIIKVYQILVIFETTNWIFLKVCIILQYHGTYITPSY